jgi:hypothetical protein
MADEMANGNSNGFDPQARYAALDERVTNLRSSFVNLEGEMRSGFASINNHLTSVSNELRVAGKTQWPVIWMAAGVVFTVLAGLGAVLYSPIKADVAKLQDNTITRSEWADNQSRSAENRQRLESLIGKLAENAVGRSELSQMVTEYRDYKARIDNELGKKLDRITWDERNHARDVEIADLQRRLDEIRQDVGSVYGTRDVIQDLKRQLDVLRQRVFESSSRGQSFPE